MLPGSTTPSSSYDAMLATPSPYRISHTSPSIAVIQPIRIGSLGTKKSKDDAEALLQLLLGSSYNRASSPGSSALESIISSFATHLPSSNCQGQRLCQTFREYDCQLTPAEATHIAGVVPSVPLATASQPTKEDVGQFRIIASCHCCRQFKPAEETTTPSELKWRCTH